MVVEIENGRNRFGRQTVLKRHGWGWARRGARSIGCHRANLNNIKRAQQSHISLHDEEFYGCCFPAGRDMLGAWGVHKSTCVRDVGSAGGGKPGLRWGRRRQRVSGEGEFAGAQDTWRGGTGPRSSSARCAGSDGCKAGDCAGSRRSHQQGGQFHPS